MLGMLQCICCREVLITIACGLLAFKLFMKWTTGMCSSNNTLEGKTVIVTGANTGIGKETARDLAKRGARVILACRDLQRANAAKDDILTSTGNTNVEVRLLDLASLASVRNFASEIVTHEPRLDVLINNAGAGGLGRAVTEDGLLMGMQVNHFGPFLLTNLLVDLMKKSGPGRIIFVSALAHKMAKFDIENLNSEKWFSNLQVYTCSKLANILNANELARRLKGSGITVNSLHPGVIHTEFLRALPRYVEWLKNCIFKYFMKTAVEGAQTTIYLAVTDDVAGVTGKYFSDCKEASTLGLAQNEDLAKKLWDRSEHFVKLKK